MADDQKLLSLSGLALHAEFGDYNRRTMGQNYFVPEQYLPARVARRLGMGYVHDRALEAHRDALGLAPSQCEIQFIKVGFSEVQFVKGGILWGTGQDSRIGCSLFR